MNMFKRLLLVLLVIVSAKSFGQNEVSNWYFGEKAGIDFNLGQSNVHNDGAMIAPAGCSTISDSDGNLLFYTNGERIWNSNHQLMDNGTELAGNPERHQSSLIVPNPSNEGIYYVFTIRAEDSEDLDFIKGIYYSVVHINESFPLGKVMEKNVRLMNTSMQRLSAIHDPENNTIKVFAHGRLNNFEGSPNNTFYTYEVSGDGVQPSTRFNTDYSVGGMHGAIRISPDGKFIIVADDGNTAIYIYRYDISNNTLTFNLQLNVDIALMSPNRPYGLEFSQDSRYIYFTATDPSNTSYLFRYDLYFNGAFSDKEMIAFSSEYNFGSLQLAPNGNIYVASFAQGTDEVQPMESIGVVNDPEDQIDPDFRPLSFGLGTGQSLKGLPNFVVSFLRNRIITENVCVSDSFNFSLDAYAMIEAVQWDFGDGTTSTLMNPVHQYSRAGRYTVVATIMLNGRQTELYKIIEAYPLPYLEQDEVLVQCDDDNDGKTFHNLYNIQDKIENPQVEYDLTFFSTLEEAVDNVNPIENPELFENQSNPQEIFVRMVSPEGCSSIGNFFIETAFTPLGDIDPMFVCEDSDNSLGNGIGRFNFRSKETEIRNLYDIPESSTVHFYPSLQEAQTKTNRIETGYFNSISTTAWVRIDNADFGCFGIKPVDLTVNDALDLNIEDAYTLCDPANNPPLILDGGGLNDSWEWRDGTNTIVSTQRELHIDEPGNYALTVTSTRNGLTCSTTKRFTVDRARSPSFLEVEAQDHEIYVSVQGFGTYEFSIDGREFYGSGTAHTFRNVSPGVYTVEVRDVEDCAPRIYRETSLIGFPRYFTPNGDGTNDIWKVYGISPQTHTYAYVEIYDRYGKILHALDLANNEQGWDGTLNGELLFRTDYWFKATLVDVDNNTTVEKGHFSLIK